jgi:hypothetical protein
MKKPAPTFSSDQPPTSSRNRIATVVPMDRPEMTRLRIAVVISAIRSSMARISVTTIS